MVRARTDDKIRALSGVGLFTGCTKRELQQVARLCVPLSVDTGFVLTVEGGPGQECYIIAGGKARVAIGGKPVGVVGPGECVGEMALLDRGPRTATVTAQTPMSLYVLSTSEFQALLSVSPVIARKIAATLARRLRALEADQPH
jgi:CRP/FNR family transcriptional regulator, cyclic AMP receptor protein